MAYRQLIIDCKSTLSFEQNNIVITRNDLVNRLPLCDVTNIVIDNPEINITSTLISECGKNNVNILFCGDNHMPTSLCHSLNQHYRPFQVIEYQINQTYDMKVYMSEQLLKIKVLNQRRVIEYINNDANAIKLLTKYQDEIVGLDEINREGTAAKVFFNSLYGTNFIRFNDDCINKALNYGYGVLRSAITRSLNMFGFTSYIGVHHVGKTNPFNLVYDIIEPFRPIIDYYVATNVLNNSDETLSTKTRRELVNILNAIVIVSDKQQTVQNAIDILIKSYLRFIELGEVNIELPNIIEIDFDILNEYI